MGEIVRNQFLDFFLVYPKNHYYDKENQFFSEQTLPALMVLNDPADHIKQKIFFLENYRVNILGFQLVLKSKIDHNLSLQYL